VAAAEAPDAPATILLAEGVHDFRLQGAEVRAQQACPATCSNDPNKTTYRVLTEGAVCDVPLVDMTRNERTLRLGSNKTLVGLGRGASLRGVSLDFGESQNVIVRNLTIFDVNPQLIEAGDAFGLVKPSGVWIDHSTTRFISDGFSDSRAGSANITISWVHFAGASPASCSGNHQRGAQFSDSTLTLHHCFFDHVDSHSPLADHPQARVHVFNNLLRDNPDYGVGAACGAEVLMEGNILEAVRYPTLRTTCPDDSQLGLILAPEGSNLYRADVGTEHRGGDGGEPRDAVSQPPYAYTVEAPEEAWLHVLSRAGAGGPWAVPVTLD
jgi:pectate lyase